MKLDPRQKSGCVGAAGAAAGAGVVEGAGVAVEELELGALEEPEELGALCASATPGALTANSNATRTRPFIIPSREPKSARLLPESSAGLKP